MKRMFKMLCNGMPLLLSIIECIYILNGGQPTFIVPSETNFHFSLITVNALFGGFLYTNYSLLIGLLDNKIIEKVKNTEIIRKRNSHILKGIVYATVSVVAGLYIVLTPTNDSGIKYTIDCFMLNVEITFMAFLILYFILSLKEMSILVNSLHGHSDAKTDSEIKRIRDKINNMPKRQ